MKNLYEITTKTGAHVCYQVAKSEQDALQFAKMYGHKGCAKAIFVRVN